MSTDAVGMQPSADRPRRSAFEWLTNWVSDQHLSEEQVPRVVQGVELFYGEAWVTVGFPIALGITEGKRRGTLRFTFIWPSAVAPAERTEHERELREAFDRDLRAPLAPTISCQLAFSHTVPQAEGAYPCYLGPSIRGYQEFAASFLATRRALYRSPAIARELSEIIRSLPEKEEERRGLAQRVSELVLRLRTA